MTSGPATEQQLPDKRPTLVSLAAFVVVIAGMKTASSLIVPFLLALFLSIICLPLLLWLKRFNVPEPLALLIILVLVIGSWFFMVILVGSTLAEFTGLVPQYQDRMKLLISQAYSWLVSRGVEVDKTMLDSIFDPGRILRLITNTMNSLVAILKNAFFILLMFSFLMIEASGFPEKIQAMRRYKEGSLSSYTAIIGMVNKYLGIKALTSLITGGLIYFGLLMQGVDFPILWALLAFILNFVPTIGSLIASIPAILLSLVQLGFSSALTTAIIFLVVNTLIGSIAEPKIMGQRVGLSTIVVFLSLIFWGWVLGPVGMLLSVPLTMAVKIGLSENENTRWISIMLAPNREVAQLRKQQTEQPPQT
ncbi:MAG: AI-2E family transporter [Desulfobulbaceae bacterium]|nr:MAG: AI-2E family transporter [Desulfobulbaceae bacterium]